MIMLFLLFGLPFLFVFFFLIFAFGDVLYEFLLTVEQEKLEHGVLDK